MRKKTDCDCWEILESVKVHAKGRCTSRFILALERAQEAISAGSPKVAIADWDRWFEDHKQRAPKPSKPTKPKKS